MCREVSEYEYFLLTFASAFLYTRSSSNSNRKQDRNRKGTPLRLLQSGSTGSQDFLQGDEPVKARFCPLGFELSDDGRAKLRQWPQVLAAAPAVGIGEKFSVTRHGTESSSGEDANYPQVTHDYGRPSGASGAVKRLPASVKSTVIHRQQARVPPPPKVVRSGVTAWNNIFPA
uniref:Uncharacterized protein n=1 Tax=Anopheles melas TaxID=34690 RepID=A0A182UIQ4_9DIPT